MYLSVTLKMEVKDFSPATAPKGWGGSKQTPIPCHATRTY
jgi:hypothetical protein